MIARYKMAQGAGGASKGGGEDSIGIACKAGAGLAFGLDGGSFTGKPFSSNNSPLRVNT